MNATPYFPWVGKFFNAWFVPLLFAFTAVVLTTIFHEAESAKTAEECLENLQEVTEDHADSVLTVHATNERASLAESRLAEKSRAFEVLAGEVEADRLADAAWWDERFLKLDEKYERTGKVHRGVASHMCDEGDRHCGKGSLCDLPSLDDPYHGACSPRRIVDSDHVFASRRELGIRCGEVVEMCLDRTGVCTYVSRGTSGPFGVTMPDRTWAVQISEDGPGVHRGSFDITTSVKDRLGHDGWDNVTVYRLRLRGAR